MIEDFIFTSALTPSYLNQLEKLMFFNPHQLKVKLGILSSIDKYGVPQIVKIGNKLRVEIERQKDVQALYALRKFKDYMILVGVMVYIRIDLENIALLHIAVSEQYTSFGNHSYCLLALRMIAKLRAIATRIRGIKNIIMIYGNDQFREIVV